MRTRIVSFLLVLPLLCCFHGTLVAQSVMTAPNEGLVSIPFEPSAALNAPADITGQWSSGATMPGDKCYNDAAIVDGILYVFGGLSLQNGALRYDTKTYAMNLATGMWSTSTPLPGARSLPVVQAVNNKIYIIGGYSSTNPFTSQAPVLEFDPDAGTFTTKASMPLAVFGAGSFVHEGRIWVLGGGTTAFASAIATIQIYDPASNTWTISPTNMPYAAWATGVAKAGTTVLLVGGTRISGSNLVFGPQVNKGTINGNEITWVQGPDYPDGSIHRFAAGSDGSKMYFAGGFSSASISAGVPSGKSYVFDPSNDTWRPLDVKPNPVYFGSNMVFDGTDKLYVVGGQPSSSVGSNFVDILNTTAEGGPIALFGKTEFDEWLKLGSTTSIKVELTNNGSAPLTWSATTSDAWITFPTASGTIQPAEKLAIVATLGTNPGNGTHYGSFAIATNDPEKQSTTVSVKLNVQTEDVDAELTALLEAGTGTWCGYCPYGVDSLKASLQRYPGRVNAIYYHGGRTYEPMLTPATDFWVNAIGLTGYPQGAVNRMVFEGNSAAAINRGEWARRIGEVLQTTRSPLTITVRDKSYDPQTKATSFTVDVFFHRGMTEPIRLNIAQVQDRMNYAQTFFPASGGTQLIYPYFHDHVMRKLLPNNAGEVISAGMPVASQTIVSKQFSFTSVDSTIETSRFIIFAHVSDGNTFGPVLQSLQIPLQSFVTDVEPLPANAGFALRQNYPNPFNPGTTLSYDLPQRSAMSLIVTDALGREVARLVDDVQDAGRHTSYFNAAGLPSGVYHVTMRAGDFVQTRSMTLMK